MDINEVRAYQAEKDHLMRHEGTHPANYSKADKPYIDARDQQYEIDRRNAAGLPAYEKTTPEQDKESQEDFKRFEKEYNK